MSVYIFVHEMKRVVLFLMVATTLAGCLSTTPTPASPTPLPTLTLTGTPNPTSTPQPTATIVPTVTVSPTTIPLEGRLFFDMNGSGLPDEATFNYDPKRLTDERQPLQADLLAAINDYVQAHPDLKKGDLITIEEPALSGYKVCADDICGTTDKEGKFTISNPTSSALTLKITDPNAGTPALEMRYINKWNGPVVIPAYEMNGVQVPEQHLNDTTVMPLGDGVLITIGADNDVGLMQGFLTRPFCATSIIPEKIFNYFDIDGTTLWKQNGSQINYLGDKTPGNPQLNPGTNDSHQGDDYSLPKGTLIYAAA